MGLGLKGFRKRQTGRNLRLILQDLYWEIRYAAQRVWRGYDDRDVFDMGYRFFDRMPVLLRDFKRHNNALWYDPEAKRQLDENETNAALDELIACFSLCNEETWHQTVGHDYDNLITTFRLLNEHRSKTLTLFSKWCTSLWY